MDVYTVIALICLILMTISTTVGMCGGVNKDTTYNYKDMKRQTYISVGYGVIMGIAIMSVIYFDK